MRTPWGLLGDYEDSVRTPWGLHEDYEDSMRTPWKPVGDCQIQQNEQKKRLRSVILWDIKKKRRRLTIRSNVVRIISSYLANWRSGRQEWSGWLQNMVTTLPTWQMPLYQDVGLGYSYNVYGPSKNQLYRRNRIKQSLGTGWIDQDTHRYLEPARSQIIQLRSRTDKSLHQNR